MHHAFAGTLTGSLSIIPPGTSINLSTNGTLDWVHWGTYTEYAYDRKAGVTPIINNYTNVGTDNKGVVSIYQFSDNTNGYSWMDGTPTISITNTTTGLWAYKGVNAGNPKPSDYIGSGFVFSVPADTTLRRLNVYAGAFNGRVRLVATLSDGSAPNYSNTALNNTNNGPSGVYTITYAANSPGQTLWVTNILAAGNGAIPNVTLQAAALSAVTNNNLPLVWFNSPANYTSFLSPTNATLDVSALDVDGSITNVEFFQSSNKLGEVATAPFTLIWSNVPAGKSILTARATDNAGATRDSTPIEVYGYNSGGSLSSTTAVTITNLLLDVDGTHDWAHWGSTSVDSFDHRAGVPQLINNSSIIGTNSVLRLTNDAMRWSWTNGTPVLSITNSTTAVYVYGYTNGFELNLPAGTNARTARIYTGVGAARGKLQASISDASAPMLTDESFQNFYKSSSRTYVLSYAAASEGQTLKIRYTDVVPFDSDFANVILRSASMDVAAPLVFLTSPANSQHFPHGTNIVLTANAQDWTGAITLVEFFADANKIGETTNNPYSITWTNPPENDHILTAKATDSNGASGTSLPVTIAVATNAKPVVSVLSPVDGAHFIEGDLISLAAQATDADDTQLTIGFYTNGVQLAATSTKPYALNWSNATAGNYILTAIVADPNGGTGTSAPVSIVVVTNSWPTVTLSSPTNGQGFFAPVNIALTAQASDSDGFVSLVEFFEDTNKLGQATAAPYTFTWPNVSKGSHPVFAKATDNRGATNSSSAISIIVSNRPPSVSLLQPTNGARFFEGTNLTLLADAQDLDGTVMLVEFFDGTNKLGEAATAPYSLIWSNVARGNYALNAHATDNEGTVTFSVTQNISVVTNAAPNVAISSPSDGQGFTTPVDVSITANATDTDGTIQLVQFFQGTNNIGQAVAPPFTIVWSNAPRGNFSLLAIAYDDWDGATVSAPITIAISNRPPTVSIATPTNRSHFFSPGPITIVANAADADGTVSLVEFYEGANKLGEATNAPFSLTWSNVPASNYTFTALATDNEGALSTSGAINVLVTTNIPPVVGISNPTNGEGFTTPLNLPITAQPSDVDGTVRLVEFFESTNKLGEASNAPFSMVWSNAPRGEFSLTAIAYDDWDGVTASMTVTITVSNRPPTVSLLTPTNGSHFFYPGTITLTAGANDDDGTVSLVEFFESTNKLGEATNAPFSLVWSNVAAANYTLTALATDNEGARTISPSVNIVVATNIPPTVALVNPTNGASFIEGDIVPLLASANDTDGTVQRVEFFDGTNKLSETTSAPFSLLWSNLTAGEYSLKAVATDDYGDATTSASVSFIVVTNQFPSVTINSPTNGSIFFAPTNVTVAASATDADGTVRRIDLFADGAELTSAPSNTLSFIWTNAPKGPHNLAAVVKDDRGATNISATVSLFVSNTPPVMAITKPTNGAVFIEGDVITLQAAASDVDGSVTLVQLFAGTNNIAAITNPPFTFNWSNVLAGSYALSAIAADNDGASVTSAVVNVTMVTNQFPSVAINSPTNGAAFFAPTNLSISASGSDTDGRIARLELFADNTKLLSSTNSVLNFTWINSPKGAHSLIAVATDDRGASNVSTTVNVVVSNRPPTISFTSPTNNSAFIEGDVIPIAASASDLDGTNLAVSFFSSTNLIAQFTNGPFSFNWSNVLAGSYALSAIATDNDGATVTSAVVNLTMVTNQFPSVTINAPTNGAAFFAPTNLLIIAAGTDVDGRIARLDLFSDNVKLTSSTNSVLTFTWTNTPKGPHALTAVATDDRGATNTSPTVNMLVSNRPPTIVLTSPTNHAVFIEGDVIQVVADATDLDGTNLVVTFFTGTNQLAQITNGPFTFSWSNVMAGSYALTALATDNDGVVVTSSVANITLFTNQYPSVSINSPTNGAAYFAPTNLLITAAAVDTDGRIARLDLFSDNLKLTGSTNSVLSFTWTNTPKGLHALTAVATDDRGATNTSSAVNIIISNRPPTIALTSPTNNAAFIEGDVITVAAAATDLDGTNLIVKLFSSTNQLTQFTNGPFNFSWSNVVAGSYTLIAIATDSDGASVTSAAVNITMVTNQFPFVAITSPTNGSTFFAPTNLSITASASDPDGRIALLDIYADSVKLMSATNSPATFVWNNAPKGAHSLVAVARDDRGATNVSTPVSLFISNSPPLIAITNPTNNSIFIEGDVITIAANARDPDGTNLIVKFFASTNQLAQFTNGPFTFSWSNVVAGAYALSATATDNDGVTVTSAVVNITMVTNQFPSVAISSPTNGSAFFAPTNLLIVANASDADGRVALLELYADSVKLTSSTNSPLSFVWTNAPKGSHSFTTVATDNRGATNTSSLVQIIVSNRPPTISLASPTNNATFIVGDRITLSAIAADADGTNVLVQFFANTNLLAQFTNGPYVFNWSNAVAGNYTLIGTTTDNDGATNSSAPINITVNTNQFPSVSILTPTNGATLFSPVDVPITATAVDVDGSITKLAVLVDGVKLGEATNSPLNLTWSNAPNGTHSLIAFAIDDRQASNTSSTASITVVPSAPNITSQPQSQTVIAGTNVTFVVNATGSPTLRYQWRLNGTNVSNATNSSYAITNVQPANNGQYSVVVTNNFGAITSSPALLTVNFGLNITWTAGGVVTKNPDRPSYAPGTTVTLTALTNWPYSFIGWSGGLSGTNNPRTVTMNSNLTAVAQFTPFIADLIIDNPQSYATGAWTSATSATNKYGTNYLTIKALQGTSPTATAKYTPNIPGTGGYDIYAWWPTFSKASTSVPILISSGGSNVTFIVNQSTGGGAWQLVATNRFFTAGTNGFGRISNDQAPQSLKDMVADAMRWVYATNQTAWTPTILAAPSNQVAVAGSLMNFSVAAVGASPLAYQWRFNGSNIAGETNATLTFAPVQSNHEGNYQVVVTNPAGAVTSGVASLAVILSAQIVTQPQPQRALAGSTTLFTVAATGTSPLAYQWRFNTAPIPRATNASLSLTNVQLANVGSYDVTVTNAGGSVTSAVATLTLNSLPTVTLLPTNGARYLEKDVIGVDVVSSDPDGTVTNILLLADGIPLMQWTGGSSNHFNWNNAVVGSHTLKAIVADNDGATNTASSTITVVTNQFPSVAIITPTNGAHYFAPTNLLINAVAADADGTVTNLEVRIDGTSVLSQTNGNNLSLIWSNALKGPHTLTAAAVDDRGATNISGPVTVIVSNRPPTVALVNPTNNSAFIEGDVIALSGAADDADGTNVLVRFLAGTNTLVSFSNAPYTFNWSNVVAGNYALSAAATDNDGATVTGAVVNVTMRTNQFPSVTILSPTNGSSFSFPANIAIQASATDSDGMVRAVEMFADGTHLAESTNSPISFVWTNAPKGSHTLTAAVTDDRGATNRSATINVFVTNSPPQVTLVAPTNGSQFVEGDTIIVSAQVSDSDGIITSVQLLEGTNILDSSTSPPFTFAWSNAVAGPYILTGRAADNDGAVTMSESVSITIVTNQNPAITFISPTNGQSFVAPVDLPITVSASDSDGSVRLVELRTDGVLIAQSSTTTASVVWTNVPKGAHHLTALAVDDRGATNVAVADINVTNALPLINLLLPTNGTKFIQGDTISMAAAATDPDGVITSVEFFEATNLLANVTNTPFGYAWSNAAPGIYSLTAQATDNDNATALSSNVTITVVTNQPPVVELITPTNTEKFMSPAAITISATASDVDGQIRLVKFFQNTNKLSEMTNGPYVFVWTNVLHGNYTLSSVATDDRGAATASTSVEIAVARRTPTLIISNAIPSMNGFAFDFATLPDWTYRIEATDSLQSSNWTVVTNIIGDGTPASIRTSLSTNQQMFYRVVAQ